MGSPCCLFFSGFLLWLFSKLRPHLHPIFLLLKPKFNSFSFLILLQNSSSEFVFRILLILLLLLRLPLQNSSSSEFIFRIRLLQNSSSSSSEIFFRILLLQNSSSAMVLSQALQDVSFCTRNCFHLSPYSLFSMVRKYDNFGLSAKMVIITLTHLRHTGQCPPSR